MNNNVTQFPLDPSAKKQFAKEVEAEIPTWSATLRRGQMTQAH
jgi:hypothetical protein